MFKRHTNIKIVESNWSYSYFDQKYFQSASLTCFDTSPSFKKAAKYVYVSESILNLEELGKVFETKTIKYL